ncbi:MAG: magnesium transporter CorA, partial [Lachnospiraceae bacterium]|nr:magnesium transporter CorA [Lachnospiraceae bacterium]
YGMNFKYMPELDERWAYPAVFVVSILVVIICILFFRKRKML